MSGKVRSEHLGIIQPCDVGVRERDSARNLHLSILTATFMVDCEWLRPCAVASTTRPKAPEPRVRPAEKGEVGMITEDRQEQERTLEKACLLSEMAPAILTGMAVVESECVWY